MLHLVGILFLHINNDAWSKAHQMHMWVKVKKIFVQDEATWIQFWKLLALLVQCDCLCVCVCLCVYIYICICVYIYIYLYLKLCWPIEYNVCYGVFVPILICAADWSGSPNILAAALHLMWGVCTIPCCSTVARIQGKQNICNTRQPFLAHWN